MSFKIPVTQPADEYAYWHKVTVDRRKGSVAVLYAIFRDEDHLRSSEPPTRIVNTITISGASAEPLLSTTNNRLYDDTKALLGRLITGTATSQEEADVDGWEALQAELAVPGVEHVDDDPFDMSGIVPSE